MQERGPLRRTMEATVCCMVMRQERAAPKLQCIEQKHAVSIPCVLDGEFASIQNGRSSAVCTDLKWDWPQRCVCHIGHAIVYCAHCRNMRVSDTLIEFESRFKITNVLVKRTCLYVLRSTKVQASHRNAAVGIRAEYKFFRVEQLARRLRGRMPINAKVDGKLVFLAETGGGVLDVEFQTM